MTYPINVSDKRQRRALGDKILHLVVLNSNALQPLCDTYAINKNTMQE